MTDDLDDLLERARAAAARLARCPGGRAALERHLRVAELVLDAHQDDRQGIIDDFGARLLLSLALPGWDWGGEWDID